MACVTLKIWIHEVNTQGTIFSSSYGCQGHANLSAHMTFLLHFGAVQGIPDSGDKGPTATLTAKHLHFTVCCTCTPYIHPGQEGEGPQLLGDHIDSKLILFNMFLN